jgi:hypothetical protein
MKSETTALVVPLTLLLALTSGCSRQPGVMAAEQNSEGGQTLPFEGASDGHGFSPTASLTAVGIPAGTLLTVRLGSGVSSATSHPGDRFQGVLDEPVVIQGRTLAPGGAAVTGSVLAAKPSGRQHEPGYLRLALTSVSIHGRLVLVQTSSIFVKGGSYQDHRLMLTGGVPEKPKGLQSVSREDVELSVGRQITFRLTQPLPVQN